MTKMKMIPKTPSEVKEERKNKKKTRVEVEAFFISSLLAGLEDGEDLRLVTAEYNISWRSFTDRRHQALWRLMQTLDLTASTEERAEILIGESGRADIADDLGAMKDIYKRTAGLSWFEHEIEAAQALGIVGGKLYLRELAGMYAVTGMTSFFAQRLGFSKKEQGAA